MGNANNWASAAAASGYTVNNSPSAGAILQTSQGAYGHVAYVESVGSDGSVTVSEMNYGHGVGKLLLHVLFQLAKLLHITTFTNSISKFKSDPKNGSLCVTFRLKRYIH